MKIEFCIESIDGAKAAEKWNADRIEICSELSKDGLSPGEELIKLCLSNFNGESHVMIRPKAGSFCYTKEEIIQMKKEITAAFYLNAHGVVFGILNAKGEIDIPSNKLLCNHAKILGLKSTFHRAFDQLLDPLKSLEELIEIGFNTLLTSGQKDKAIEGISIIEELVNLSKNRIEIMAGSGIDHTNLIALKNSGVHAAHFSVDNKSDHTINNDKIEKIMRLISQ